MDDPGPVGAQAFQDLGQRLQPFAVEDSEHLTLHPGRIGQRSDQIENRADPQLAPRCRDVTHGSMMPRRHQKGDTQFIEAAFTEVDRWLEINPEF